MKIILGAGKGSITNIVYYAINQKFSFEKVILKDFVSRVELLKRRCK